MPRNHMTSAAITLCCAVAGVGLVGCDDEPTATPAASASPSVTTSAPATEQPDDDKGLFQGTKKIKVDGQSVNVSCSGQLAAGQPVVVLLHGGGDSVKKMAGFQRTLSKKSRVCSYDRLGAGASDEPEGSQSIEDSGKVLSGVLDGIADDRPVVLAGHSLGGLIAARYAPDHQDRVKGLVLMDATSPTQSADLAKDVPKSADDGPATELRDQMLPVLKGQNPEKLVFPDGKVRSAGDIPVEVLQHGQRYLAQVPEYGAAMELSWSEGQRKWLAVSSDSSLRIAAKSGHHIYVDQPDLAAKAIARVAAQAGDRE